MEGLQDKGAYLGPWTHPDAQTCTEMLGGNQVQAVILL